jgi:hypothetical protein
MNDSQRLFAANYGKYFPIKVEDITMSKEKPSRKTLARHGSLDEYVDGLPAYEEQAVKDKSVSATTSIDKIIQAAIEIRTERNLLEDAVDGGEIQWAEAMTEPVNKLVVALNLYQASDFPIFKADDTFNDDTPAQTFGDIKWDMGTGEKCEEVIVIPCPSCDRAVPYDSHGALFLIGSLAVCNHCCVKNSREKLNAGKMRLIGIAGQARSGKDTLASYLMSNLSDDWSCSSFADPIKNMLTAIGVDCSDEAKAVVSDDYGVTPRHMMQTLGTEWGRNLIDGDIWVKAFARLNAGMCVIVPDVRFENEADLVREHGVLIHLTGRGGIEGNHVSENAIEFKAGDIVIDNSRDLAWMHGQVDSNAVLGSFISEVGE